MRRPRGDIDTTFDFRQDTPAGKDPDKWSPTLRRYHRVLWSKRLPSGAMFDLVDTAPSVYLLHRSILGEFRLSSDSVIPSLSRRRAMEDMVDRLPRGRLERFQRTAYTIGGMMLFPSNTVDRKMTINGARGCHPRIQDRFDLTVECIRRHYVGESSPLADTLRRYDSFFGLFGSFGAYVDYFLLNDIVTDGARQVRFHHPFDGFDASPLPPDLRSYMRYMDAAEGFVRARNRRIRHSRAQTNPSSHDA